MLDGDNQALLVEKKLFIADRTQWEKALDGMGSKPHVQSCPSIGTSIAQATSSIEVN
jgi:hypothetical protein